MFPLFIFFAYLFVSSELLKWGIVNARFMTGSEKRAFERPLLIKVDVNALECAFFGLLWSKLLHSHSYAHLLDRFWDVRTKPLNTC